MQEGLAQGICTSVASPLQLKFTVPGDISRNPIEAFKQGLRGEGQSSRSYDIAGTRCTACGYLELYAQ
jgi:hypothetical protein